MSRHYRVRVRGALLHVLYVAHGQRKLFKATSLRLCCECGCIQGEQCFDILQHGAEYINVCRYKLPVQLPSKTASYFVGQFVREAGERWRELPMLVLLALSSARR